MANIIRRGEGRAPARRERDIGWDPFRAMRELLQFDPLRELELIGREGFAPSFDVKETKDAYVFRADLPGVKEEDIDISLTGNQLRISGERVQENVEEGDRFYTTECSYGSFSRTFMLPEGVDAEHVRAEMKEGVLTVSLPKKPEVQPKRIPVGGEQKEKKAKA